MITPSAIAPLVPGNLLPSTSPWGNAIALPPTTEASSNDEGNLGEGAIANAPSFGIDGVNFNSETSPEAPATNLEPE
ncbi:MAG: hypothetical protein VKJ64_17845, partial [Leptolyngbyaceae bacterium]|nr:hypothetical protein [Leptolyngbyaceae bacterium]